MGPIKISQAGLRCEQIALKLSHPPHSGPAIIEGVSLCSPYLFGKKLLSMQGKLVKNKLTFSETKLI